MIGTPTAATIAAISRAPVLAPQHLRAGRCPQRPRRARTLPIVMFPSPSLRPVSGGLERR